ncbi:MAG: hypothetical protein N4A68_14275 [Maledivibacter sp.]|jgi:hypothetical protein|nr:hypothetical protein [Maledivibacter sp.]
MESKVSRQRAIKADDDVFNVAEVNTKEWERRDFGRSVGVRERGMYKK